MTTPDLLTSGLKPCSACGGPTVSCDRCQGQGWIEGSTSGHGCDGTDEDCARSCPIQVQTQEHCDQCGGSGLMRPTPPADSRLVKLEALLVAAKKSRDEGYCEIFSRDEETRLENSEGTNELEAVLDSLDASPTGTAVCQDCNGTGRLLRNPKYVCDPCEGTGQENRGGG